MFKQEICDELVDKRRGGASVADLVTYLRETCGFSEPGTGRLIVVGYLKTAFSLPLPRVQTLTGWVGFGDRDGNITDDDLEEEIGPLLDLSL